MECRRNFDKRVNRFFLLLPGIYGRAKERKKNKKRLTKNGCNLRGKIISRASAASSHFLREGENYCMSRM